MVTFGLKGIFFNCTSGVLPTRSRIPDMLLSLMVYPVKTGANIDGKRLAGNRCYRQMKYFTALVSSRSKWPRPPCLKLSFPAQASRFYFYLNHESYLHLIVIYF